MMRILAAALLHFLWEGALIGCLYATARRVQGVSARPQARYLLGCLSLALMAAAPAITFLMLSPASPAASPLGTVRAVVSAAAGAGAMNGFAPVITAGSGAPDWIAMVWLAGVLGCSLRLLGGWCFASRIARQESAAAPAKWQSAVDRLGTRLRAGRRVRLFTSSKVEAPTVVGWLRPVILIPASALTGLGPELLEALFAHELMHIRRHDYAVNIFQGIVEALLFYHPAVWWISRQIREDRELCCDDGAVSACGNTLTYVRALAEFESRRSFHRFPALAANGGSLTRRIARLLGMSPPAARTGTPLLAVAAILAGALVSNGQQAIVAASSLPGFEVASIKPSGPDTSLKVDFAAGGRLTVTHATLRFLIKIAYDVTDDQILGGPGWVNSKRFDVQAKPPKPLSGDPTVMTKDQILLFHAPTRLRLQRLLADRFHLALRKESKAMPIFALEPGRNGPKLTRSATTGAPDVNFDHGILLAKRMDMATLARFLSEGQVGRPVEDMTGIAGQYDIRLEWAPDPGLNPANAGSSQPVVALDGRVSVFTALQQQLGLKLESKTSPADTLVVTGAELPGAN